MIWFSCVQSTSSARTWTHANIFALSSPSPPTRGEDRYCLKTALKTFHIIDFAFGSAVANDCEALVLVMDSTANPERDFTPQVLHQLQQFYDSATTRARAYLWLHSSSQQSDNPSEEEKFMEAFPSLTILQTSMRNQQDDNLFTAWSMVFQTLVPEQINELCGDDAYLIDAATRIILAGNGEGKMRALASAAIDLIEPGNDDDNSGWTRVLLQNGTRLQLSPLASGLWLISTCEEDSRKLALLHQALTRCCEILLPTTTIIL